MTEILTKEDVLNALRKVYDPELNRDLVSLNMIRDLIIENGLVKFNIELTTPACPMKNKIELDARNAVMALPGVREVQVVMSSKVKGTGKPENKFNLAIKNIVAIGSGKGGVGKTTISVNVAITLAQSGAKVGLLDADIYGPNIPMMMGVTQLPDPTQDKICPAEAYGVKVMSIGFLVKSGQPLIWRGPMLHSTLQQFFSEVDWGELDYLIIDLPPGTGDAQISISQIVNVNGGVIVTLPQKVSVEDARRGVEMFKRFQPPIPVLGIIENMSYLDLGNGQTMEIFGSGGGKVLAEQTRTPFLGSIPIDPAVREGSDNGVPLVISYPESPTSKIFKQITERIASGLSVLAYLQEHHV